VRLSFNARGQFLSSPQWSGDLQLIDPPNTGAFHIEKKPGSFDLKGGAPSWSLANALAFGKFYGRGTATGIISDKPLMLENWQLHAGGAANRLAFENSATITGGLSELKGVVEPTPTGPRTHFEAALKDVPASALWSALGESIPLDGKVTAEAKDVELVLSTHTASTMKGVGYWELKEGHYRVPELSLKKLAKAKTMAYVRKKFPDLQTTGLPVARLSGHWQAKDGIITVDDGLLVSTDLKAGWVGKLDAVRQGLDGYVRLQIGEKDPKLKSLIPERYRSQPAIGRLQGAWQEWALRAVPASKIPAAVQAKLRNAINQK